MMCWEIQKVPWLEESNKDTDIKDGRADDEMQKPKDEEEHVDSTLHTGN